MRSLLTATGGDHIIRAAVDWAVDGVLVPQLDVAELARQGRTWHGAIDVAAFERLGGLLFGPGTATRTETPSVWADLEFALDPDGRPWVRGICKVEAPIYCTWCAQTVPVEVISELDFRVVRTEAQADALMPAFDALVSAEDRVPLTALVEDDILLSIPERCCVDAANCDHAGEVESATHEAEPPTAKPLSGLRALVAHHEPAL